MYPTLEGNFVMKPNLRDLQRVNQTIRKGSERLYYRVLRRAIAQWSRVSGDRKMLGYFRARDFAKLYNSADSLVEQQYATAALHFAANQLSALIRKYPWDSTLIGTRPEEKALESFMKAEHRCKWMNRKFLALNRNFSEDESFLSVARSWIRYVLGDVPDLAKVYQYADFSGGAALGVHGNATNLMRKLQVNRWTVSPGALPYLAAALSQNFHYAFRFAQSGPSGIRSFHVSEDDMRRYCELVSYNKVEYVPKTAKTHRSIAVEPLGNVYLQKGVDKLMREHLKRVGIDLKWQHPNQEMARLGSLSGDEEGFCTIDLSAASDSVSIGLVKNLLPPEWFELLDRLRSPSFRTSGSDKEHRYHKFCSMGNGFCFPLETLIFASLCHAAGCGRAGIDFRVYGDDIVVRRRYFPVVMSFLKKCGFKPNKKKTFFEGPFRESCGGNWYGGIDVTPFTLDFKLDSLSSLFKFVNLARRNDLTSVFLSECVADVLSVIPDRWLLFRPFKGPVDSAIDSLDVTYSVKAMKSFSRSKVLPWRNQRYQSPTWWEVHAVPVSDTVRSVLPDVVMAAALRGNPSYQPFTLRRKFKTRLRAIVGYGTRCTVATTESFEFSVAGS